MNLKEYFETTKGIGVLSTADKNGNVDAALYSRPHFMDNGTIAFIMNDRLTHHNLTSNPHAAYLFKEDGPGFKGKRLYLKKVREEEDMELLYELSKRTYPSKEEARKNTKFLVFFEITKELPLVGGGD